jgi:large subunit ribosomal protein L13
MIKMVDKMIIDGKNAILGRIASYSAKQLLKGDEVVIVNAAEIVITGNPKQIVGKYLKRRRGGSAHHGPFFPKNSDLIVRRAVRGMIPKTKKGRAAFRKLRVHISVPPELKDKKMEKIAIKKVKINFIRVEELAKALGWKG